MSIKLYPEKNHEPAFPTTNAQLADKLTQQATNGIIGRHVKWLKDPSSNKISKIFKTILAILETIFLSISIVGIPSISKAFKISGKLNAYSILKNDQRLLTLPKIGLIKSKTTTQTFNHLNDYIIHDDKIWVRRKYKISSDWQVVPYIAKNKHDKPVSIKADGANLMISDEKGDIHYKKVLSEWRDKQGVYHCRDKSTKDNWYDRWFSFPIFEKVHHLFAKKILSLPQDIKAWTTSHRGEFNKQFEDICNRPHPEFSMVTTNFAIPQNGEDLVYADPYLTTRFNNFIKGPSKSFIGDNIDASASTVFLIGKENGKTKMYTRLVDFDLLGKNPFLPGFWSKKFRPSESWKEEPEIPLSGKASINPKTLTISQTGIGNAARVLSIEGTNDNNQMGLYYKNINDSRWNFM